MRNLLTVTGAAELLGVHANTVRSWTDQGVLTCLRINARGDRRYRHEEISRFLAGATSDAGRHAPRGPARAPKRRLGADPVERSARRAREILDAVANVAADATGLRATSVAVGEVLHDAAGYEAVGLVEENARVTAIVGKVRSERALLRRALEAGAPIVGRARAGGGYRAVVPLPPEPGGPRALILAGTALTATPTEPALLAAVCAQLAAAVRVRARLTEAQEARRRAEVLMEVSSDIGSHLELPRVLSQLVDRAAELFHADHAAVFSMTAAGGIKARATRDLSTEYIQTIEHATSLPLMGRAFGERTVVSAPDFADDPRALELRRAIIREGINTITVAPLLSDGEALGVLVLYHDARFNWATDDLALLERLARQASAVLRNAQNFSQMATWAAQLQSIQQLGSRLTRLRTVAEIGQAICAELNQLIDFHNVRVYRVDGDDCVPVAWRGQIGEYEGEDMEQLRLRVGQGVTGWVARYGLAQNVGDAANDERAQTIPGTEDDLDESLLLAPMLYEDEVIGVIVLAKLGLNQFSVDDLRLLEIYASIAAQAMASADATEQLRAQSETLARQLNSQRELLRVTESILSTLDTQELLDEIAERLKALVHVDNIAVDIHDQRAGLLRPIFARGVHALEYLAATIPDSVGIGGQVVRSGAAELVQDELTDQRVAHFSGMDPQPGALIVAPLRSGDRVQGLLTIERLGDQARFTNEEFELVQLFAAHVSIALQNAETHRAVELRAETDTLTGLWNHGALTDQIDELVARRERFAMLMVDLDFFKRYNDSFGHQAGNVMLQRVGALLRASCRDADRVFRYGGDEFVFLLPNTSLAGARTVADKVQAAVLSASHGRPMPAPLTCSIGIAVFPTDGDDGQSIILAADRACYAAKRAGRARVATAIEGLALVGEFEPTQPAAIHVVEPALEAAEPQAGVAPRVGSYSVV